MKHNCFNNVECKVTSTKNYLKFNIDGNCTFIQICTTCRMNIQLNIAHISYTWLIMDGNTFMQ